MPRFQITNRTSGLDLGTFDGDTAYDAIESMHRDAGYASSADAAEALGTTIEALIADIHAVPVADFDAAAIIEEEGMGFASVGPVASLVVTDDGRLADDRAFEPADLSSPDAFRAQVRRWREAMA